MRTHFAVEADTPLGARSECGRGKRLTENVFRVDCLVCQTKPAFGAAFIAAEKAREDAFWAQEPRTVVPQFGRVNDDGVMECPWCGGILWRERPRDLWSYHYVCANDECGKSVHPLTETGMSS